MSNYNKTVKDTFQAFLVKGAIFTKKEEYPIIESKFVPKQVPLKIMSFKEAIVSKCDLSDTVISFYSSDESFERIRRNPRKYVSFFKRTGGIIGFDYSIHSDMPIIKQKSQMNDNLSLSYYYASMGIPIYPSPRGGSSNINDDYLEAFPHNTLLALGVHGFIRQRQEKYEWYLWIKKIIDDLSPTGIIIIGKLNDRIFDEFKKKTNFYYYDSYMEKYYKEVNNHVDKGAK